ncbi:MAG: ribbon-helix-helix domain-containing protein [Acidobacteria bacterium]|nr:ribbon-helix-helix domain-containing protein [Acidobacteriota bacterium]
MVRTQIQLTETQTGRLKRLAAERGVSMAELVREGVDRVLEAAPATTQGDKMHRAMRAFGSFHSGLSDLATRHDGGFAMAVSPRATVYPIARAARPRRAARHS